MSLKKNIIANYASQIYVTLIGIIMVPLYIKYMGAEAYGLVGFFAMLQAWFNLLDMGLTPTVARETARHHGGAISALDYRRLIRALEGVFATVALVGGAFLLLASEYISHNWLRVSVLPLAKVTLSVQLMAIIIALRWTCGLYRGVISGSQRLVWLSGFNAAVASLRFVVVMPLLIYVSASPTMFFGYQLGVAIIEFALLCFFAYQLLPRLNGASRPAWAWAPLKPVLKFSLSIAFTSTVWILLTQTDKLVLSKLLTLAEYGYYSVAVTVAAGIMFVSGPVSSALTPRMAKLEAEGDHQGLIYLYRNATQLVSVFGGATAVTVAFCAEPLLWAWTGDRELAQRAAPVLTLYALGNGILVVSAFPFYLQYAKGDLRLHLFGNFAFLIIFVPSIIWSTVNYGMIGAAATWLSLNCLSFIAWLPFVHRKFDVSLNRKWYLNDTTPILLSMILSGIFGARVIEFSGDRFVQVLKIFELGVSTFLVGALSSSTVRLKLLSRFEKVKN